MPTLSRLASIARALALAASGLVLSAGAALAQDGAQPREIPEGFVVPGPPPTGAVPVPVPGAQPRDIPEDFVLPGPPPVGADDDGGEAPAPRAPVRPESLAVAPAEGTTNWPCVQRKVDEIAPAAIWSGPDVSLASGLARTSEMTDLVDVLASRRTPLPEAEAQAVAFAEGLPEDGREAGTTAVFADLLTRLNAERGRIIAGIERYGARQKEFAESLRQRHSEFDALRASGADRLTVDQAREALLFDQRVFDERRQSLTYVCEVPILIEQRAFGLARALASTLDG